MSFSKSKPIKFMQMARYKDGVHAIHWPECDYNFAVGHSFHHAIEEKDHILVFFTNDKSIQRYDIDRFFKQLKDGALLWILVDLEAASNPISERNPAMSKRGKK